MALLPIHDGRPLGHVPPRTRRNVSGKPRLDVIPEADWAPFDLREAGAPVQVKDQNGYGACNGHAAASALEWARWIAGYEHHDLSAWFVYAILCGGIDRGSNIGDALKLTSETGDCLDATVPHGTINPRKLPAAAKAEAGRFRIEIGAPMSTFAEHATAAALRRPYNFSIRVGNNFDRLDADGVCGYSRGAGNHAIVGGLGLKRTRSGEWAILAMNSWTTSWGDGGFFWYTARHWDNQPYRESYCVHAVEADPQGPNPPHPAA